MPPPPPTVTLCDFHSFLMRVFKNDVFWNNHNPETETETETETVPSPPIL
jgi:hypothetical protein